jgi:hypothetical protein
MNDFADGPVELASLGARSIIPNLEVGFDRRAPIVKMRFSHDGKRLFFVGPQRDYIRSMYVSGPSGVKIHQSLFNTNTAQQGAGINIERAQGDVEIIKSGFSGKTFS